MFHIEMSAASTATGAANTEVSIVLPTHPNPLLRWRIPQIFFSYAGGSSLAGRLRVIVRNEANSADELTVLDMDISQTREGFAYFESPLPLPVNRAIAVRLGAGGAGVIGKLNLPNPFSE
jgi:hypothetical protein